MIDRPEMFVVLVDEFDDRLIVEFDHLIIFSEMMLEMILVQTMAHAIETELAIDDPIGTY